jgi:hypothetical protein
MAKTYKVISNYDYWLLKKYYRMDLYAFGTFEQFQNSFTFPVTQVDTKENIIKTLEYWKNEIDVNNEYMQEMENKFLHVLRARK